MLKQFFCFNKSIVFFSENSKHNYSKTNSKQPLGSCNYVVAVITGLVIALTFNTLTVQGPVFSTLEQNIFLLNHEPYALAQLLSSRTELLAALST